MNETAHHSRPKRARGGVTLLVLLAVSTAVACSVSRQEEIALGRQYAAQIDAELPLVQDGAAVQYVNQLGNRIARHGDRNLVYTFKIVNSNVVNAFAVPGGFIYVNRGLIERAESMSEFAGVLAHEIAHVEERHSAEQLERAQTANVGLSLAYVLLGRRPSGVERAAINVGGGLVLASYSRDAEREADEKAVPLLIAAGIDPNGLVSFLHKLIEDQQGSPSTLAQWFSTHPTTEDRIDETRQRIAQVPAARLRGLATESQSFDAFQARIRRLPAAPSGGLH